ncbi:hypothetical protein JCM8097_002467 [Rhodosporidiobolus ruineniae]
MSDPAYRLQGTQEDPTTIQTTSNTTQHAPVNVAAPGVGSGSHDIAHPVQLKEDADRHRRDAELAVNDREQLEREGAGSGLDRVTTGLGGMVLHPIAALEKVAPSLAHNVENAASSVAQRIQDFAGQAKESAASAAPATQSSGPVIRPGGEVTEAKGEAALEKTSATGSSTTHSLAETASQTLNTVKAYLPSSLGGTAGSVTDQIPAFTVLSSSTEGIEPPGARKQVHDPRETGSDFVQPKAAPPRSGVTATVPEAPTEGVAGYAHVAVEKVREIGNKAAEYLPSGEQQQKAADSTASVLASTATTAKEQAAHAAEVVQPHLPAKLGGTGTSAATEPQSTINVAPVVVGASPSQSSTYETTRETGGQTLSLAQHKAGENFAAAKATTASAAESAKATAQDTLDAARETLSQGKATVEKTAEEKKPDLSALRGDSAYSASEAGTATIFRSSEETSLEHTGRGFGDELSKEPEVKAYEQQRGDVPVGESGVKALTSKPHPSTEGKEEGKGFDLRQTHDEPAVSQQSSTHNPYTSLSHATSPDAAINTGSTSTSASPSTGTANPAASYDRTGEQLGGGEARFVPGQTRDAQPLPESGFSHHDGSAPPASREAAGYAAAAGSLGQASAHGADPATAGHTGGARYYPHQQEDVREQTSITHPPDIDYAGTGSPATYSATHTSQDTSSTSPSSAGLAGSFHPSGQQYTQDDLVGKGEPRTYSAAHSAGPGEDVQHEEGTEGHSSGGIRAKITSKLHLGKVVHQ